MHFHLHKTVATAVEPTPRVLEIAAMFGLGIDENHTRTLVPACDLVLNSGDLAFITGPSGSGKSTLLRLIAAAAPPDAQVTRLDDLPALPDRPVIDCFGDLPLAAALKTLSRAGLGDAFVMLRRPGELSDGQRFRLRLAQLLTAVQRAHDEDEGVTTHLVLADEFGATLDRITARVIARNLRRWTTRLTAQGLSLCVIVAAAQDDLLESLAPDVLIEQTLDAQMHIHYRNPLNCRP